MLLNSFSLIDEYDDISLDDGSLMPRKRRVMDAGGERLVVVYLKEDDFII